MDTSVAVVEGNTLADRIKSLLGKNLPTSMVASAVGCDPSYVSQLLEDEDFKNEVLIARAGKAEEAIKRDGSWDDIEDLALERAKMVLPHVTRPADLIRIASIANAAKRRAAELSGGNENAAPVVQLVLPESSIIHFQMNAQSQVVEVEGQSMLPLSSKNLAAQMAARKQQRQDAGVVTVEAKTPPPQLPAERKRAVSILEQIGYADEPVPVPKVQS